MANVGQSACDSPAGQRFDMHRDRFRGESSKAAKAAVKVKRPSLFRTGRLR
jgi:hypothetical protein